MVLLSGKRSLKSAGLGLIFTGKKIGNFVKSYGGQELGGLLADKSDQFLDEVIAQERQGSPDQPPLILMVRSKGHPVYVPRSIATTSQKNQYLRRKNKTLVDIREKAKLLRDEIQIDGDLAEELFLVGRALEDEAGDIVRVVPMTRAKLQLLFPDWCAEDQFGGSDEDDSERD